MDIVEPDLEELRAHGWREAERAADMIEYMKEEIARLQAENERLRKTLQVIADNPTWLDHGPRAQTALAPPPQR